MTSADDILHSRSLSLGSLPLFVERREAPGRLRPRIEASAAGLSELNLLREHQRQMFQEAKEIMMHTRPRASTVSSAEVRSELTRRHHVREVEMKPEVPAPSRRSSHTRRRSLRDSPPPPSEYLGSRQRAYSFSLYSGESEGTPDCDSPTGSASPISSISPDDRVSEFSDQYSPCSSHGGHFEYPDGPFSRGSFSSSREGRRRCDSNASSPTPWSGSLLSLNEDLADGIVRSDSHRPRSASLPHDDRSKLKLSLPRGCGAIDEGEDPSENESRPRSRSFSGPEMSHMRLSLPDSYSPLWRNVVGGKNMSETPSRSSRVSRSPSVASDLSNASSLCSTGSEESFMRPRTLSGSSLTFHFPSPMHAVLMQYDKTMVDPGATEQTNGAAGAEPTVGTDGPTLCTNKDTGLEDEQSKGHSGCDMEGMISGVNTALAQSSGDEDQTLRNTRTEIQGPRGDVEEITHKKKFHQTAKPILESVVPKVSKAEPRPCPHPLKIRKVGLQNTVIKDMPLIPMKARTMSLLRDTTTNVNISDSTIQSTSQSPDNGFGTITSAAPPSNLSIREPNLEKNAAHDGRHSEHRRSQSLSIIPDRNSSSVIVNENTVSRRKYTYQTDPVSAPCRTTGQTDQRSTYNGATLFSQDLFPSKYILQWGRSDFIETVI